VLARLHEIVELVRSRTVDLDADEPALLGEFELLPVGALDAHHAVLHRLLELRLLVGGREREVRHGQGGDGSRGAQEVAPSARAKIAIDELCAALSPSLIGLPARMLANNSSCSTWYMSFASPSNSHGLPAPAAGVTVCFMSCAWPRVPKTWSLTSDGHPPIC